LGTATLFSAAISLRTGRLPGVLLVLLGCGLSGIPLSASIVLSESGTEARQKQCSTEHQLVPHNG
jgi:hypothetical protein